MKTKFVALLSLAMTAASFLHAKPLEVGDHAPEINARDQHGADVALADLYQDGYTLVYFYPKADTPGCTKQACSLRDDFEALTDRGVTVVGVSADSVDDQMAFAEKFDLPFTLLADTDKTVINAFGVPTSPRGFAKRQAFLIKAGVVVWRDLEASTAEQAADVQAALDKAGLAKS